MRAITKSKAIVGLVAVFLVSLCAVGNVGLAEAQSVGTLEKVGMKASESLGSCIGGNILGICIQFLSPLLAMMWAPFTCGLSLLGLFLPIPDPLVLFSFTEIGTQISAVLIGLLLSLIERPLSILYSISDSLRLSGFVGSFLKGMFSGLWGTVRGSYPMRICYIAIEGAINEAFGNTTA